MTAPDKPALPEPYDRLRLRGLPRGIPVFTADQMRAYGEACAAHLVRGMRLRANVKVRGAP